MELREPSTRTESIVAALQKLKSDLHGKTPTDAQLLEHGGGGGDDLATLKRLYRLLAWFDKTTPTWRAGGRA